MTPNASSIVAAIRRLGSGDAKERVSARESLEELGGPATWHLVQATYPPGERTRHEAMKALVSIGDPALADFFVEHLEDEDSDCRWLAAEGLGGLGDVGLRRALELLIEYPKTDRLLRSVHHALGESQKKGFMEVTAPVLQAFQSKVPQTALPTAALQALNGLRSSSH